MYEIKKYSKDLQSDVVNFYRFVLPESGRELDLNGRHKVFNNIDLYYDKFWCLYDDNEPCGDVRLSDIDIRRKKHGDASRRDENKLIGTVGLKSIDKEKCELKALYLYKSYHGQGLGYMLLSKAIECAKQEGYSEIYLDTLSTSERAIRLYKSVGFEETSRYNDNQAADVFMVIKLNQKCN